MPLAQLMTAEQLAAHLQQPTLRVLDCRFALEDRDYGARSFAQAHIPGACFLDLERDLSGAVIAGRTGRHPLPPVSWPRGPGAPWSTPHPWPRTTPTTRRPDC